MKCANAVYSAKTPDGRSGGGDAVDFLGGTGKTGECQIIQRRVVWLCDTCAGSHIVETWGPPAMQVRPSRSFGRGAGRVLSQGAWRKGWQECPVL
jgi:hypothetical protein